MGHGMRQCVDEGELNEIEADLVNTGVLVNAKGEVFGRLSVVFTPPPCQAQGDQHRDVALGDIPGCVCGPVENHR